MLQKPAGKTVMRSRNGTIAGIAAAAVMIWIAGAFAQDLDVKAWVDKTQVGLNQQFTLNIQVSGSDARGAEPAVPELDAFAAFLGSGSSQNIQVINGKMSVSRILSYQYQAVKTGTFTIPAISITANKKKAATNPITITVVKTAAAQQRPVSPGNQSRESGTGIADEDLFLRVTADKRTVFQNEPVVLTYTLYTRVSVTSFEYSKLPETAGFWVEDFPIGRQPQTSTEVYNGKRYTTAVLKKMALFPMSPGSKAIDPLRLTCNITVRGRSQDIFDGFFNSALGRTVRKSIASKPVRVTVKPLPDTGKPAGFSGVVGRYRMTAAVDKRNVTTDDAVTFTLTVTGEGNIKTLPDPDVTFPSAFEVYPPSVHEDIDRTGSSVSGKKTFEWVIIPRATGTHTIPSVSFPVFDPVTASYRTLTTDPVRISVAQGSGTRTAAASGLSKEEVRLLGQDIRFIHTEPPVFVRMGKGRAMPLLFWIILVLPLLALGGALAYSRFRGKLETDVAYARNRRAGKAARRRLATAERLLKSGEQNEFFSETGKAILNFLADKLNIPAASIMTDEVRELLKARNVPEQTIAAAVHCLEICDRQRFSPSVIDREEMQTFFNECSNAINGLDRVLS